MSNIPSKKNTAYSYTPFLLFTTELLLKYPDLLIVFI